MMTGTILGGFENLAADTAAARQVWERWGHTKRETLEVACMVPMYCAPTRREAIETMRPHHRYYIEKLCQFFAPRTEWERRKRLGNLPPGRLPYWEQPPSWEAALAERMVICGNPDDCLRQIEDFEKAGVTHILGLVQMGGMQHERVMAGIDIIGQQVIPDLQAQG